MKEWMGLRRSEKRKWDVQRSFKWKKKKWARSIEERFYLSEEKVTGKDFSDNNIYCGTVALLEGLFWHTFITCTWIDTGKKIWVNLYCDSNTYVSRHNFYLFHDN